MKPRAPMTEGELKRWLDWAASVPVEWNYVLLTTRRPLVRLVEVYTVRADRRQR